MFRLLLSGAALAIVLTSTAPAYALFCSSTGTGFSARFSNFMDLNQDSEQDELDNALIRLRRAGVDTNRVEKWSGCYRAFVRQPDGSTIFQFYDPRTLEQVR